jgi:hypothetical protein
MNNATIYIGAIIAITALELALMVKFMGNTGRER